MMKKNSKTYRLLEISNRLVQGDCLNKKQLADAYEVDTKSIQRDMEDIRSFLSDLRDEAFYGKLIYDYSQKGYKLEGRDTNGLSKEMVLSISKILLESRAFVESELKQILGVLLKGLPYDSRRLVNEIVLNQQFYYQSPTHNKALLHRISDLSTNIFKKQTIEIHYKRSDNESKIRRINPLALVFSECYFYLIADIADKAYTHPAIFRVDRIEDIKLTDKQFRVTTANRFEDGKFVNKVPFMYAGPLQKICFDFYGNDPGVVMDRIPSAEYSIKDTGVYAFEAEVFGDGILMWLLSQGSNVKVTGPCQLIEKLKKQLNQMRAYYFKEEQVTR